MNGGPDEAKDHEWPSLRTRGCGSRQRTTLGDLARTERFTKWKYCVNQPRSAPPPRHTPRSQAPIRHPRIAGMNGTIPGGDKFETLLEDRLLERVAGELRGLVRNSIRVVPRAAETDLPVGVSRIGGRPDLPPNTAWPTGRGNYSPPTDAFRRDHPDDTTRRPAGLSRCPLWLRSIWPK